MRSAEKELEMPLDGIDPEATRVIIGKEEVFIPPMTWYVLKLCWPLFDPAKQKPAEEKTISDIIDEAITMIAAALVLSRPEYTIDYINKHLRWDEREGLLRASTELLAKSGFTNAGEAVATSQEGPGMGTLNGSSPNASLVEFATETGTELNKQ